MVFPATLLTLRGCSLSISLSFPQKFRFGSQCPHSFHMLLLRLLPVRHLRPEMFPAIFGAWR